VLSYARKRDRNHSAIADALRALGYAVTDLSGAGDGVGDLLVSRDRRMLCVEVKMPGATKPAGQLRAKVRARQVAFAELHAGCVVTATSAEDVDNAFQIG
jgi:Holliday junction resolvase